MKSGHFAFPRKTMKECPVDIRPREKLLTSGAESLSNHELLALILGSGSRGESALALAQRLLEAGDTSYLMDITTSELGRYRGIGPAKACQVKAALELGRRMSRIALTSKPVVRSPKQAADLLSGEIGYMDRETVRVLNLNTASQVMAIDLVSIGGLSSAPVHPREVFKLPMKRGAAGIIMLHNHPSGNVEPSAQDIQITERLYKVGRLVGIELYDHLVLAGNNYYSMKEAGLFNQFNGEET